MWTTCSISDCGGLPMRTAWLALLLFVGPAQAGLYYSGEVIADLPAQWRGFLPDHRTLRLLAVPKTSHPLRDAYLAERDRLTKLASERPLTADEAADLGALQMRLGQPSEALAVLRAAQAKFPDHFRIAANLGTAWQLNGDLDQASLALRQAVALAPPKHGPTESQHLKLVALRRAEPRGSQKLDRLFEERPPTDAVAQVQQLALWLPADGRLLWQLGELAHAHGDVRTAAAILDGCVSEFGLGDPELRRRRAAYRTAADELAKQSATPAEHERHVGIAFRSPRPLARRFDPARLPPVRPDGVNPLPWAVLTATTLDRQSRPTFQPHLRALDGKKVLLTGFLQPVGDDPDAGAFLLIEYPVGCWYCEVPEPTGVVLIELPPGKTATLTKNLVKVTGRLALNSADPENFMFTLREAALGLPD
jgi:hypothetical protein